MDISSARLASLLRQAMAPQPAPSAKADPVKTALVKALVQPPLPSLRPQQAAPALAALPALTDRPQQLASARIVQAYLALTEPGEGTTSEAGSTSTAREPAAQADEIQRGLPTTAVKAEGIGSTKPAPLSLFALVAPQVSTPRRAFAIKATAAQGRAANQLDGNAPRNPQHWPAAIGLASMAVGLVAFGIIAFAWLVLH